MNPYPLEIKYPDFNSGVPQIILPPRPTLHLTKSAIEKKIHNSVADRKCGVEKIWLNSLTTGVMSNVSYKSNDNPHANIPGNDPSRYCFAPTQEDIWIRWTHIKPRLIKESRLELFCRINGVLTSIWKKTFIWKKCHTEARTRFQGDLTLFDEALDKQNNPDLESVSLDYDDSTFGALFPGGCVTAEFSPYKLQVSVVPISSRTSVLPRTSWMYFDVNVKEIDVEWCPETELDKVLPNTNKAKNLAVSRSLMNNADANNLNGALPIPGQTKKVYLKSHTFYKTASELTDITYFNRYMALWGDGAIFPIFASAKIKDSAGNAQDVPLALGKLKYMWDWVDKASDPYTAIGDASIQSWIDQSRDYKAAVTAESPAGKNCHVDRGGKRGMGAKTCFPQQAGKPPADALPAHDGTDQMFPFQVEPLNGGASPFAARKWAAYSYSRASGALAGKTGVLFQPSRMGGDGYEVNVYLAYDTDHEMETSAAPGTMPAGLHKNTGIFQIWREMDIIKHWRLKTTSQDGAILQLALSKTKFEKYFIKINIPNAVDYDIGTWFASLQNVCNGIAPPNPPLPDYIRAAVNPALRSHLVPIVDYKDWYSKMLTAHGPDDATLANWANGINNPLDALGQPRYAGWELETGGNGNQPVRMPWDLNFLPDINNVDEGTVTISFPDCLERHPVNPNDKGIASFDIVFEKAGIRRLAKTSLTANMRQQLKGKLKEAYEIHARRTGDTSLPSYQRGKVPHTPLRIQLQGFNTNTRGTDRLDNVRAALEELKWELFKNMGNNTYEQNNVKYCWSPLVFESVIDNLVGNQAGILALQITDISNNTMPKGKAFYANAAGDRAFAATMEPDPAQQTFEHEIGHALFLGHTYHSQLPSDPNFLHQKNSPTAGACIMHYSPSTSCGANNLFCGFCIVRMWGWSFQKIDPATGTFAIPASRTLWYDSAYNKDPGSPGGIPPHPTDKGTNQVETLTVQGAVAGAGNAMVTVTAAGMPNSPKVVSVAVVVPDSAADVAGKIRAALGLDPDVSSFFTIGGNNAQVMLNALQVAANDPTMNIAIANGTCAGLTPVAVSNHTTAGAVVPPHP